jgi:hypothetical protein
LFDKKCGENERERGLWGVDSGRKREKREREGGRDENNEVGETRDSEKREREREEIVIGECVCVKRGSVCVCVQRRKRERREREKREINGLTFSSNANKELFISPSLPLHRFPHLSRRALQYSALQAEASLAMCEG